MIRKTMNAITGRTMKKRGLNEKNCTEQDNENPAKIIMASFLLKEMNQKHQVAKNVGVASQYRYS